jgi:hypothetical protein
LSSQPLIADVAPLWITAVNSKIWKFSAEVHGLNVAMWNQFNLNFPFSI